MFIVAEAGHSKHDGICLCGTGVTFKVFLDGEGRISLSKVESESKWQATQEQIGQIATRARRRAEAARINLEKPFDALFQALQKGKAPKVRFKRHKEKAVITMADKLYELIGGRDLPDEVVNGLADQVWKEADEMSRLKATVAFAMEGKRKGGIIITGYNALKEDGRWANKSS